MTNKTINYSVEELKQKILDYNEAAQEAYSVRDGNLYMMYKDLRDLMLERYYEATRHAK